jgi:seryl-tRNA synthetase
MEQTTRYYINLNKAKDKRDVAIREIRDEQEKQAFEAKLVRNKNLVESTKDGIVLDELDSATEKEYNELISVKSKLNESIKREIELIETINELKQEITGINEAIANRQEQVNGIAEIKPLETTGTPVNNNPNTVVVEIEKVNSVPVNTNENVVTKVVTKPKKRKMGRRKNLPKSK